MLERIRGGHVLELLGGAAAKRAAGCREDQPAHFSVAAAMQALVNRVVLAVDGQDGHALAAGGVHHQAAGHDQHFLVRQGDGLARLDRAQHGVEGGRTGRCTQHDVDVGMGRDLAETFVADAAVLGW